jgi:anthranilate phosphoribosyltransferase
LKDGKVETFEIAPEQYGLERANPKEIKGGDAQENAQIIRKLLDGEKGPKRNMILLNAAAAFVVAGLDEDFVRGIERAEDCIDSGRAKEKLEALIDFTQKCEVAE